MFLCFILLCKTSWHYWHCIKWPPAVQYPVLPLGGARLSILLLIWEGRSQSLNRICLFIRPLNRLISGTIYENRVYHVVQAHYWGQFCIIVFKFRVYSRYMQFLMQPLCVAKGGGNNNKTHFKNGGSTKSKSSSFICLLVCTYLAVKEALKRSCSHSTLAARPLRLCGQATDLWSCGR